MNCQSRIRGPFRPPDPGPGAGESPLENLPAAPSRSAARAAELRPAASLPTSPYTAGPQELCPTPAAPHSAIRRPASPTGPGRRSPPCCGGEPGAGDPLDLGERGAEARAGRPHQRGQQLHQHQMGDPLDLPLGGRRKLLERRGLGLAAQARARPAAPRPRSASAAGTAKRASSGAISSAPARRPPSTMKPPRANVQVPIADRAAPADRPRQLRRLRSAARAARPVPGLPPGRAGCPSRARCAPGCARWTVRRAPPLRP